MSARPHLSAVQVAPVFYGPAWHARGALSLSDPEFHRHPIGAICCYCRLDIAVPPKFKGFTVACTYCGLDRGELPAQEVELGARRGELS